MIHLIDRFTDQLKKGKYNNVTVKAYRDAVFMFYNKYRDVPTNRLDEQKVQEYLNFLRVEKDFSRDVIAQNGKAIKLYFKLILDKPLEISATGKAKLEPPYILSKIEVSKIIQETTNKKHQLIIKLAYGLGLKLNELINLQISHVDFLKQQLTVPGGSNSEDRVLNLGSQLGAELKQFIDAKSITTEYLFTNSKGATISPRGVQIYFSKVVANLNMNSAITLQNLRHSYAVHLLNKGIDLHHVQKALGHKYLQTTALYQPLITFSIEKLESPFDDLL